MSYKNKSKNTYIMNNNICEKCIELKKDIDVLNARLSCVEYDNEELKEENKELRKENQELRKENQECKKRIIFLENKIAIL